MALTDDYEPGYPPVAANAAWQKKKSYADKTKKATKTGLGAKLIAAQAAYDKVKFDLLDAVKVADRLEDTHRETLLGGANEVEMLMQQAKDAAASHQRAIVAPAVLALNAAETAAKVTAKNKLLSAPAQQAARIIAAALHEHAVALRDIQHDTLDDFVKQTDALKERLGHAQG